MLSARGKSEQTAIPYILPLPIPAIVILLRSFCQAEKHHPALIQLLCTELGVQPESLLDFELCLADTQPAVSPKTSVGFFFFDFAGYETA